MRPIKNTPSQTEMRFTEFYRMNLLTKQFTKTAFLILVVLTSFNSISSTVSKDYEFKSLDTVGNTLSDHYLRIYQQKNGYLWFGTDSGASRYDGKHFINYEQDYRSERSINGTIISDFEETSDGSFWIATETGLNRQFPDGRIKHYVSEANNKDSIGSDWIIDLFETKEGILLVGTGDGLSIYDPEKDTFTNVTFLSRFVDKQFLQFVSMVETLEGKIYIGTSESILVLDVESKKITWLEHADETNKEKLDVSVLDLKLDSNGDVWVATYEKGLYRIIKGENKVTQVKDIKGNIVSGDSPITALEIDKSGAVWIGSRKGITIFDTETKSTIMLGHDEFAKGTLPSDFVTDIFMDDSGLVWVATTKGVVNYSSLTGSSNIYTKNADKTGLSGTSVYHTKISDDLIYLSTNSGINALNYKTGKVSIQPLTIGDGSMLHSVWSSDVSHDGVLWTASREGLISYNPDGTLKNDYFKNGTVDVFKNKEFYTVKEGANNEIWVTGATGTGLMKFDPTTGAIKKYLSDPEHSYNSGGNFTQIVYISKNGKVWLAATDGIYMVDDESSKIYNYPLKDGGVEIRVSSITEDDDGVIWFGTQGVGLVHIVASNEPENDKIVYINNEVPLNEDVINNVLYGGDNLFWLTTKNYLVSYNHESKRVTRYTNSYRSGKLTYSRASGSYKDGTLFLGTTNGLQVIDTYSLGVNDYNPPVVITRVKTQESEFLFNVPTADEDSIIFPFDENSVEFSFASLDYTDPTKNRYRYKLDGFDVDWHLTTGISNAVYTNLNAGDYSFVVQGTNSDGLWVSESARFDFTITPPWWFYALIIGGSVIVLIIVLYVVNRRVHLKQRRVQVELLRVRSITDPLTGLANRYEFKQRLDGLISNDDGTEEFHLIFIDLDHFKFVNDSIGHTVGDKLLKIVASRIKSVIRKDDLLVRLGGDEFAIIMPSNGNVTEVENTTERIRKKIADSYLIDDNMISCSASIGVACYPYDGKDAETLTKNSDTSMYAAKRSGRDRCYFFDKKLSTELQEKFVISSRLPRAIADKEFELHYQPKVCLKTNSVKGFEALLRWITPEGQFIPPDKFIEVAEQNGAIYELGEWVLNEACKQAAIWIKQGVMTGHMSVNLSPKQISQPAIVDIVKNALLKTGVPAHMLELEITESVLLQNVEVTKRVLKEFTDLGVSVALDDFGTGYSSMSYLTEFTFDTLKIDRSFLFNIESDKSRLIVLKNIIRLAQDLDMSLVAEGVETELHAEMLRGYKCDLYQGWLFSKALPADKATKILINNINNLNNLNNLNSSTAV
jgi:diguanylate cyclase (GGDEF)-like protein